jgi:hypothetical protein
VADKPSEQGVRFGAFIWQHAWRSIISEAIRGHAENTKKETRSLSWLGLHSPRNFGRGVEKSSESSALNSPYVFCWVLTEREEVCTAEPATSGTGIPVRFGREPEEFKFQFKNPSSICLDRYTGPAQTVTGRWEKNRISGEFDVFRNSN